jgi:hypothetical protein
MTIKGVTRNVGKKALNSAHSYFYDADHKKEAMKAVHVIQEYNSQKLTHRSKKIADEYSIEVLGSKNYSPWLYVYTLVKGNFQEGWIPDNFFGKLVCPRINKELRAMTGFKSFTNVVLRTEALPDIAYYIDGIFYNRELSVISIYKLREQVSTSQREMFVKKDRSGRGTGVSKITVEELTEDKFQRIGNCVIQSSIKQHEFFEEIIPGSVATVRITTIKDKSGRIDLRAAYLRLGRKDTSWVQSDNSVRVAIINDSGDMDSFGYTQDWRRWLSHPDSGFSFENRRIPKFKEAIGACIELHNKVPHFTIIGWDITVGDNEEIKIMEWNSDHCDIKFSEASTGPCFLGLDWEKYREN